MKNGMSEKLFIAILATVAALATFIKIFAKASPVAGVAAEMVVQPVEDNANRALGYFSFAPPYLLAPPVQNILPALSRYNAAGGCNTCGGNNGS